MPALIRPPKGRGSRVAPRGIKPAKFQKGWFRVVCCASGPSLTREQTLEIQGHRPWWRTIVVNTTWQMMPDADVLYAGDRSWWELHVAAVREKFWGGVLDV